MFESCNFDFKKEQNTPIEKDFFKYGVSLIPANVTYAHSARNDVHDMSLFEKALNDKIIKDINASDNLGWTFLHYAAARNNPDAIDFLVKHGADIELKNRESETALYLATIMENIDAIKELVKLGANIDTRNSIGNHVLFIVEHLRNNEIKNILQLEKNKETMDIYNNPKFDNLYKIRLRKEFSENLRSR